MKPVLNSHSIYQDSVLERLRIHYSGGIFVIVNSDWHLVAKFWMIDLSYLTTLLQDSYDPKGPKPRDPASMLRSFLLFLMTNPEIGITEWVNQMKRVPYYAILSGFEPGDIPWVGTFYDFFKHLWASSEKNLKPQRRKKRNRKVKKGKKGEKAPTTTPGKVKRLVAWMIRHADIKTALPSDRLFHFFQTQILTISAKLGLLGDIDSLSVAGDRTPIVTSVYPRIYSQPDCNSGWDSSREKYFNGYHLYILSAADSHYDLPLYPRLHPASRHDADAIYHLLDNQNTEPFIDLNSRSKKNTATTSDISISPRGIPICSCNLEMKRNGKDNTQHRQKWRCSLSSGTKNSCATPCSKAKYWRTFHTHFKDNLRLFPKTSRESVKWKMIYKRRTSIERSNKREKIDYKLESGRHRSTQMWYVRVYGIMICQHLYAWFSHLEDSFAELS
jgi:hypothetical protein